MNDEEQEKVASGTILEMSTVSRTFLAVRQPRLLSVWPTWDRGSSQWRREAVECPG